MERFGRRDMQTEFVRFDVHKCKACWKCHEKCPEVIDRISFLWHKHVVIGNADECIGCLKCVKVSSEGAFSRIENKR